MKVVDELGMRMKTYEVVSKPFLTLRLPKIIRLDMRSGHTFTKHFKRPYDKVFAECMQYTTKHLCENIPGVVMGYSQSDEISLVINDIGKNNKSKCFFNGNVEKMVSLSASEATLAFNKRFLELAEENKDDIYKKKIWKATFDSRTFVLPNIMEVHNYLVWRQNDATKNSISSLAHTLFSTKELKRKNRNEMQDMMMLQYGVNWNDYPIDFKRGFCYVKELYYKKGKTPNGEEVEVPRKRWAKIEIPILTKDLEFVEKVFEENLWYKNTFISKEELG